MRKRQVRQHAGIIGQLLLIALLLMLVTACVGTDTEITIRPDGDMDGGDDNEPDSLDGDDAEGFADGDWAPDSPDADVDNPADGDEVVDFYPPMLSDPGLLPLIFGEDSESTNIDFGQSLVGRMGDDMPYVPFTFDALPGAQVTMTVEAESDNVFPILVLYGPRGENGLWGSALAYSERDGAAGSGSRRVVLAGVPIPNYGHYLILVTRRDTTASPVSFTLSLGCHNQCREPRCPDLTCQAYCSGGFLRDPDGCYSCVCTDDPSELIECGSNADCPVDSACMDGFCIYGGSPEGCDCDADFEPVCGVDSLTYGNACEADCFGVEVAYAGVCDDEIDGPACSFDSDCPDNAVCMEGACIVQPDDCACPDVFDPVCGLDSRTYNNECELECANMGLEHFGICNGGEICEPICDVDLDRWTDSCTGEEIAPGPCVSCEARCRNAGSPEEGWYSNCDDELIELAYCRDACGCADVYNPVCGTDGQTYSSPCQADCASVPVAYAGDCADSVIGCLSDDECPAPQICMVADDCLEPELCPGVCVLPDGLPCADDTDCPASTYCNADYGICVDFSDTGCVITGCHGEICAPTQMESSCQWRPEFACYAMAECAVLETGLCGWRDTSDGELELCLASVEVGTSCTVDSDCPAGYFCEQHTSCMPSECVCPPEYSPVCATNGQTYDNACQASCNNAEPLYSGQC